MRCVDVNVLVYAHREDARGHAAYNDWLQAARQADEPLALTGIVLSGFLRVVTHPRVFRQPTPLETALRFIETLRAGPNVLMLEPGARHWGIFTRLCTAADVHGNLVPDAYLAALAMEHGATWYSADRGFARYPGLAWRHPLES